MLHMQHEFVLIRGSVFFPQRGRRGLDWLTPGLELFSRLRNFSFALMEMQWIIRLAAEQDIPQLEDLIPLSVRALQKPYYSPAQMEAALGPVFGVDRQLIRDSTYFVVEHEGQIIGCGGWSRRKALFGGDQERAAEDDLLEPRQDRARVRAFFVHPDWARRGIGRRMLEECEAAILKAGFNNVELVATLAGEPLYANWGYKAVERYEVPMSGGLTLPVVRMTREL